MKTKKTMLKKVESNEVFNQLKNNLKVLEDLTIEKHKCQITYEFVNSLVTQGKKTIVRQHPTISIGLNQYKDSLIRFAPCDNNGIEITRIIIGSSDRGKNLGSFLMNTLFLFIYETLGYIPPIFLECTGGIYNGEEFIENSIQNQTKFFRKFGFRVTNKKFYPEYVRMDYFQDKNPMEKEIQYPIGIAA
jgi:hypothetical protein